MLPSCQPHASHITVMGAACLFILLSFPPLFYLIFHSFPRLSFLMEFRSNILCVWVQSCRSPGPVSFCLLSACSAYIEHDFTATLAHLICPTWANLHGMASLRKVFSTSTEMEQPSVNACFSFRIVLPALFQQSASHMSPCDRPLSTSYTSSHPRLPSITRVNC